MHKMGRPQSSGSSCGPEKINFEHKEQIVLERSARLNLDPGRGDRVTGVTGLTGLTSLLLQLNIQRGRLLANDHPKGTASCK